MGRVAAELVFQHHGERGEVVKPENGGARRAEKAGKMVVGFQEPESNARR